MALTNQTLTFGNVLSSDYGVYISGEGVFNAPKRDAKLITIPGRNGDFVQDNGRFENITITYPCFYKGGTLAAFATALSNFRNAICAQKGYQKLTDTINAGEYRQALFIDGINFKPVNDNTVVTFDLVFNCKPQRWLDSGDTKSTIANGGTLTNPTLFAAPPLFEVVGYGTIGMTAGGVTQSIKVLNMDTGEVILGEPWTGVYKPSEAVSASQSLDTSALNTGDAIKIASALINYSLTPNIGVTVEATSITNSTGNANAYISGRSFNFDFGTLEYIKGTSATKTHSATLNYKVNGASLTKNVTITVTFNGSSALAVTATAASSNMGLRVALGEPTGYSTKQNQGTTYIDCENGLCWQDLNGTLTSADAYVDLPAELPRLAANATTSFSKPNTITTLKVTPRWWKI